MPPFAVPNKEHTSLLMQMRCGSTQSRSIASSDASSTRPNINQNQDHSISSKCVCVSCGSSLAAMARPLPDHGWFFQCTKTVAALFKTLVPPRFLGRNGSCLVNHGIPSQLETSPGSHGRVERVVVFGTFRILIVVFVGPHGRRVVFVAVLFRTQAPPRLLGRHGWCFVDHGVPFQLETSPGSDGRVKRVVLGTFCILVVVGPLGRRRGQCRDPPRVVRAGRRGGATSGNPRRVIGNLARRLCCVFGPSPLMRKRRGDLFADSKTLWKLDSGGASHADC
jgi:hypothetical protein